MIQRRDNLGECLQSFRDRLCRWLGVVAVVIVASFVGDQAVGANEVDYNQQIKPLLQSRCYGCHGALKQKARLRLDTVESMLQGGKSGPAVRRGDAVKSLLIQRVIETQLDERMPPEHEGEALSQGQVALMRQWIADGAQAPADETPEADPKEHWAFRPIKRPKVPLVGKTDWGRNPIDVFLGQKREALGIHPQPEASGPVQLRRVYLDLIGLPPEPEEVVRIARVDTSLWYERTVQRLLQDPRHGERWARHWMDIWRYSDWWGLGQELRNSQKHLWHWRDWMVESFNSDMPYDEMIRLMLAADELHPGDTDKLRATGFLARNYFLFNRDRWLEETVEHVGKGFLGLTLNCAKCHDHKYDPIAQKDFYRMRAFFEPYQVRLDMLPGETDLARNGLPRAFDAKLETPTYVFVRGQEMQPDKSELIQVGVPELLAFKPLSIRPVTLPAVAWQPERQSWVLLNHCESARRLVQQAEVASDQGRNKFEETRRSPGLSTEVVPRDSGGGPTSLSAVELAEGEFKLAVLSLDSARAEQKAVERRAEAMRATWLTENSAGHMLEPAPKSAEQEAITAAIRAERELALAKSRQVLAAIEWRLRLAKADQKAGLEKEMTAARDSFEKAAKAVESPVASGDRFSRLTGSKWTTTRFIHPDRDDPSFEFPRESSGRRSALADWITDPRNPLTARVAVNHVWARHMGAPLVSPVFDFGRKGKPPDHPELLDWLASELIESGWSLKHLHGLIVTSAAYRMSSSVTGAGVSAIRDPDNRYWWRRTPIRLEAEVVRDSILSMAGALDTTRGGPSVAPADQASSRRRSLYFFHSNNDRNLFLTTFDEAAVIECYQREQSVVPQQALALSNSAFVHDAAGWIAARISRPAASMATESMSDLEFVRGAFERILGQSPTEAQMAASLKALVAWREENSAETAQSDLDGISDVERRHRDSRRYLMWALLNHNDFVTLR